MLRGQILSSGIGYGKVLVLKNNDIYLGKKKVKNTEAEVIRFQQAINSIKKEMKEMINNFKGTELDIIESYLVLLNDPNLKLETINLIKKLNYSAEYAVEVGFNNIIQRFEKIDYDYIKERSNDIKDIKNRIIEKLVFEKNINLNKIEPNIILVSKELSISDITKIDLKKVSGIITESGGIYSHCSIIAREHNIPWITEIKDDIKKIKNAEFIAIDGISGKIYLNPTEQEKNKLELLKKQMQNEYKELMKYKNKETVTKDGCKINLYSNIEVINDIKFALENTAEGIGLFRSEFLYIEKIPTEEEQYKIYKKIAEKMYNMPVIIRTFDIGGDKEMKYLNTKHKVKNRGIRISLENKEIFKTQLRAILRASIHRNVSIMFPMITSIEEVKKAKDLVEECKIELDKEKRLYNKEIKIGIMIETPAAALISDALAKQCDFFSIGTNDLVQYIMATERENANNHKLYYHPSVIKLINETIKNANKSNIPCEICGEITADELIIPLLIGLGINQYSMNSSNILKTRRLINILERKRCELLVEKVVNLTSIMEVEKALSDFNVTLDKIIKV